MKLKTSYILENKLLYRERKKNSQGKANWELRGNNVISQVARLEVMLKGPRNIYSFICSVFHS